MSTKAKQQAKTIVLDTLTFGYVAAKWFASVRG